MDHQDKYDEVSVLDIVKIIWKNKFKIIFTTSFFALVSVIYSLSLPNIYSSKTLLAPTTTDESLSGKLQGLSFAGFQAPSTGATSSQEAVARIKSLQFFSQHFLPYIKLENLAAVKNWNSKTNTLDYDSNIYNDGIWFDKPSIQEAYKIYKNILSISEDQNTLFITISIDHKSPHISSNWVALIIKRINENMRDLDAHQAQKAIEYLTDANNNTKVQSIKDAISKLLEDQMQTLMLTASNQNYIYKVIDLPVAPEEKIKPSRVIICLFGTIFGGIFSIFIVIMLHFRNPSRS